MNSGLAQGTMITKDGKMNKTELNKKLDPKYVKKHPYTGMDYIEGWHAIAEANRIFDFDGWERRTLDNREVARYEVSIGANKKPGYKVCYEALVEITVFSKDKTIVRQGTGHGTGQMTDLADCIEGAAKEAETDAMKRALMTFGNPFGLALYDKEKKSVGIETTRIDKMQIRDFMYGLGKCMSVEAIDSYVTAWKDDLAKLPEHDKGSLRDAVSGRKVAIKNNATLPKQKYTYVDVQEAVDYMEFFKEEIEKITDGQEVEDYYDYNLDMIAALDDRLSAQKYQVNGLKPSQQLHNIYSEKLETLAKGQKNEKEI